MDCRRFPTDLSRDSGGESGSALSRRDFIVALGAGALAARAGEVRAATRNIIDVHAHYMSPEVRTAGAGGPMASWSLQAHLEEMDKAGVARSLLSLTTPGIAATGERGRSLVRATNEYVARLMSDNRGRIGSFLYLQALDIDGSLKEIEYGLDTLKANGVNLYTSYEGKWLGDPVFEPIFAELERRKAVVYVHPTSGPCCRGILPGVADTVVEYGTDTTRAITSYVYRGAARKYPNVKMIWSHSGGTMPFLIERFDFVDRTPRPEAPQGFRAEIAKFFYDVAQASNAAATGALRKVVPTSQIVFGTDYPFRTMIEHVEALEKAKVFGGAELRGVYHDNIARGLPGIVA